MPSYDPPEWEERNKKAILSAFERAQKIQQAAATIEPPTPKPAIKLEMKGPIGEEVRQEVAKENAAVLRAQKIAAEGLQAGHEKEAKSQALGAQYEASKTEGQTVQDMKPAAAKLEQAHDHVQAAKDEEQRRLAVARALKVAEQFNGMAQSKDHEL